MEATASLPPRLPAANCPHRSSLVLAPSSTTRPPPRRSPSLETPRHRGALCVCLSPPQLHPYTLHFSINVVNKFPSLSDDDTQRLSLLSSLCKQSAPVASLSHILSLPNKEGKSRERGSSLRLPSLLTSLALQSIGYQEGILLRERESLSVCTYR